MELDRGLQYKILFYLHETYPQETDLRKAPFFDDENFQPNAWYLDEHKLIAACAKRDRVIGAYPKMYSAKMTAKGLDFLADDGGLGAILQTVTVKFEVENIRQIFQENILKSNLPENQKQDLLYKIKGISGDVLKSFMTDLLKKGLENPALWTIVIDLLSRI